MKMPTNRRSCSTRVWAGLAVLAVMSSVGCLALGANAVGMATEEVIVQHYDPLGLMLQYFGGKLIGFQLDRYRTETAARREEDGQLAKDAVVPGEGAMGVRFGDSREAVAKQLGAEPVTSYGFEGPSSSGGVDTYRVLGGIISVTVNRDQVTQVYGYGVKFKSPLGFESGMEPATVKAVLGNPDSQERRTYYQVAGGTFLTMALLAMALGVVGAGVLVATTHFRPLPHWVNVTLGGATIGLVTYWLKPVPLLAQGLYPLHVAPLFGMASWIVTWLGAAFSADVWRRLPRKGAGGRGETWANGRALMRAIAAGLAGAVALNLCVRLSCSLYTLARPYESIVYLPMSAWSTWLAIGIIAVLAAASSYVARLQRRRHKRVRPLADATWRPSDMTQMAT